MTGLRTAIYKVSNLEEAKKWYTAAFGKAPYFDEPFYAGFNIGGYELGLLPDATSTGTEKSTSVLAYWAVENIEATFSRLTELGGREQEAPKMWEVNLWLHLYTIHGEILLGLYIILILNWKTSTHVILSTGYSISVHIIRDCIAFLRG